MEVGDVKKTMAAYIEKEIVHGDHSSEEQEEIKEENIYEEVRIP